MIRFRNLIELDQRTPEWLAWRESCYTASQAAAVMGEGAFWPKTPFQLYLLRTGQREVFVNQAMRDGSADEAKALAVIAWTNDLDPQPACAEADFNGMRLGASLDALCQVTAQAWEIKRQLKGTEGKLWTATVAPPEYFWQMVHTLLVLPDLEVIHLSAYAHDTGEVRTVETLHRDSDRYREAAERLLLGWRAFHQALEALKPPPLGAGDEVTLDGDSDWMHAAAEYAQNAAAVKALEARQEVLKASLVQMAQAKGAGAKVVGAGLQCFKYERAGNVNWKAKPILEALAAAKVDPEKFRGKSSVVWVVKEAAES